MEEEKQKVIQEKQEEINQVNEELKKHQEAHSAEATAMEETSRFVLGNLCCSYPSFLCPFFVFYFFLYVCHLIEPCSRCSLVLQKRKSR